MKRFFSTTIHFDLAHLGLLLMRVGLGAVMLTHGWPKLQMILSGNMQFADPIGIGPEASLYLSTFAEFGCAILLILGLFTRLAALALAINMAVAFFVAHAGQPFAEREMPMLFLLGFVFLLIVGPGKHSLDNLLLNDEDRRENPRRNRNTSTARANTTTVREVHQNRDEDGNYREGHHTETRKERAASAAAEAKPVRERNTDSKSESRTRAPRGAKSDNAEGGEKRPTRSGGNNRKKQSS